MSEKERKDKGKKPAISAVDGEEVAANEMGDQGGQPNLAAKVALLRRQLQDLTEQLRRDKKQQHNQHDVARSATSNRGGGIVSSSLFIFLSKNKCGITAVL